MKYEKFLQTKQFIDEKSGFEIDLNNLNPILFDWQKVITRWAIARGRAAIFAGCGLGKTLMQAEWCYQIHKKENNPILIIAPLAVSFQTIQLAKKEMGIDINLCENQDDIINGINITNYEKLHKFDASVLCAVCLDESSIIKAFSSSTRNQIIEMFSKTKYRLACTATPAPNDYIELGNHAEYLGSMTRVEMLSTFFINDTKDTGDWRLKGHVKNNIFWKWLSSWSVMIEKPSDIGFEDGVFILPEIIYHEHILKSTAKPKSGFFLKTAKTMEDRRHVRNDTIQERVNDAVNLINQDNDGWIIWVNLNPEGEFANKQIENSIEVAGRHSDEIKTDRMLGFSNGKYLRLISKPKIAGFGMNFQICSNAAFIGLSDSWEQFYQAVRRIWRFGQKNKVHIHIFIEEREGNVLKNIYRKEKQARAMLENMIINMKDLMQTELGQTSRTFIDYLPTKDMEIPEWLN